MAFVKLDTGILRSTLWDDRNGRDVFLTALLMAEPFELLEPTQTYEVRSLTPTDFVVPPGWYGMVEAAGVGIVRLSLADMDAGMAALDRLSKPELESRSQDFEGRRLVRVNGGYIVLNFMKYRDRDYSTAVRSQRYRDRKASKVSTKSFSAAWDGIVGFYGGLCAYCEKALWTEIDHVIPTSKGGKHDPSNVVPACKPCNSSKRDRPVSPVRRHPLLADITRDVVTVTRDITQAEAELEAELEAKAKETTLARKAAPIDEEFLHAWSIYPKRAGGNSRADAIKVWSARLAAGVPKEELFAGVERYAAFCKATGKTGTEYVMQASRFFGRSDPWAELWDIPANGSNGAKHSTVDQMQDSMHRLFGATRP